MEPHHTASPSSIGGDVHPEQFVQTLIIFLHLGVLGLFFGGTMVFMGRTVPEIESISQELVGVDWRELPVYRVPSVDSPCADRILYRYCHHCRPNPAETDRGQDGKAGLHYRIET